MTAWLALLLHAALVLAVAPMLAGIWRGIPAQPWRDLIRLARKPTLPPGEASFLVAAAPPLGLAAAATAAVLVPGFCLGMASAGGSDLVVVVALLALSRAAPALAAFDAGGMAAHAGAQVEAARLQTEPVLLLGVLAAALLGGGTNLDAMAGRDGMVGPGLLMGAALLAVVGREPPAPAFVSGRGLVLLTMAAHLRHLAGLSVVAAVALPFGMAGPGAGIGAWVVGAACWVLKLVALAGVAERTERWGMRVVSRGAVLQGAAVLALLAAVLLAAQARA